MDFIINIIALLLIGFIVWWFWLSKAKTVKVTSNIIEIIVENGVYTPSRIEVPAGEKITLRFIRKDPGLCAEKVIFNDFNISETLPVNKPKDIIINADKEGEHAFTCQMQMYRGYLIVHN